jgi:hypothetical protein
MGTSVVRAAVIRGAPAARYHRHMAAQFDPDAMVERFRARASAVRSRGLPPVEGPDRERFKQQAQADFMDFAMIGDAQPSLEDGILTLRIDLRPAAAEEA